MKQNNYEHIAIYDANRSNVASQRLQAKQQQNKQHKLLTYSSVVAVSALALLSSTVLLPLFKQQNLDTEVHALTENNQVITETVTQATQPKVVSSKLADQNNLFQNYGTEAMHRSNDEQERALLYLLHKTSEVEGKATEEVLKVKELEWDNDIKTVANKPANTKHKSTSKANSKQVTNKTKATKQTEPTETYILEVKTSEVKPTATNSVAKPKLAPVKQPVVHSTEPADTKFVKATNATESVDDFAKDLTDRELMYYIVMAETGYADTDSISLVAQVIVNRTHVLGESLRSVLTSPDQFSCYENGSYKRNAPTARVRQICDAALAGAPIGQYVLPRDVIFYCTVNYYTTRPTFFVGLKRILKHNTQVFFAPSTSSSQAMDNWELPAETKAEEELPKIEDDKDPTVIQANSELEKILE